MPTIDQDSPGDVSLSLLLPSRGRPGLLRRLLDSVAATAAAPSEIEVVLYLDRDDEPSHEADHPHLRINRLVAGPAGMGRMVRACFQASAGRHVMLMNDDIVCRTPGWDRRLIDAAERFGDGVAIVWCNDLFRGPLLPNFPLLPRTTCLLLDDICPGDYRRDYVDTHLWDVFRKLAALGQQRMVYLDDVVLEHLHVEAGKAEFDPTYIKHRKFVDELAYIAWEDERSAMAAALARRIRSAKRQAGFGGGRHDTAAARCGACLAPRPAPLEGCCGELGLLWRQFRVKAAAAGVSRPPGEARRGGRVIRKAKAAANFFVRIRAYNRHCRRQWRRTFVRLRAAGWRTITLFGPGQSLCRLHPLAKAAGLDAVLRGAEEADESLRGLAEGDQPVVIASPVNAEAYARRLVNLGVRKGRIVTMGPTAAAVLVENQAAVR